MTSPVWMATVLSEANLILV